jgi:hypothetical protein
MISNEPGRSQVKETILVCVAGLALLVGCPSAAQVVHVAEKDAKLGNQASGANGFDRYSGEASRALLFARMEASRVGSSTIEPEHLLLGLIQKAESPTTVALSGLTVVEVRERLTPRVGSRQTTPASAEISFSNATTRVLQFAVGEADRLGDIHIGPEHLLLGLLREPSTAATILSERGLRLDAARQLVAASPGYPGLGALTGALWQASEKQPRAQLDQLTTLLRIVTRQVENLANDPTVGPVPARLLADLQGLVNAVETGAGLDLDGARRRIAREPRRDYQDVRPRVALAFGTNTSPRDRLDQLTTFLKILATEVEALVATTSDVGENAEAFRLLEGLRGLNLSRGGQA